MSGKPMNGRYYPRYNRMSMLPGHKFTTDSPKMTRRRFLNEMRRSNNPIAACANAGVMYRWYEESVSSGFITQDMLDEALTIYRLKHADISPGVPSMVLKHTDKELETLGYATGVVVDDLNSDGWDDLGSGYDYDEW